MSAVPLSEIVESFATELAGVVGALAEAAVTVEAGTTRPDRRTFPRNPLAPADQS